MRAPRLLLLVAGLALFVGAGALGGAPRTSGSLLGPVGPMLAQVQWVRARLARDAGLEGRSLALMESARDLDRGSHAAWSSLADHMGLTLASAESGRSGHERATWLAGALALLAEGEAEVEHADELAFHAGVLLMSHAETDPDLPFLDEASGERGTRGLWLAAARAFDHAAGLDHPEGEGAAAFCRRVADDPDSL